MFSSVLSRGLAAVVLLGALAGCSGATFDEAIGVPDSLDWSYFQGSFYDVRSAVEETLNANDLRVEGVRDEDGGTVLTVTRGGASSDIREIRIEPTDAEGYGARAQVFPQGAPLPRWLEIGVSGRL